MPSPRSSPALRPRSPLSPRYESSTPRFDTLQSPTSPRKMHSSRSGASQRYAHTNSLKLPSLPRFHPANFPSASAQSSAQNTPESVGMHQPPPPTASSQRPNHNRGISDAQKHLLVYQRDMVQAARSSGDPDKPESPKLAPLGSPGPVTPLELGGGEGGYFGGARASTKPEGTPDDLMERLVREDAARRSRPAHSPSSSRPTSR